MKPETFRQLIRRVLNEEVEKTSVTGKTTFNRVPEIVHGEDYKEIMPNKRADMSKDNLLADMDKVVKAIDPEYIVVWDDHDDISISARDLFRIRIIPKWEGNFCIEAMTRNEDRIYITGQTWEQVKQFVKVNLKDSKTKVDVAYDKSKKNVTADETSAPDKGMPQKDKPNILPLTNEPPKETKNKERDYTEKQVKKEKDLPEKPMKEVEDFERQKEHRVMSPLKIRRERTKYPVKKPNTTLTVKL
jgi:hypothetical protein